MHIHFYNPWALLLVWLVPLFGIAWLASRHMRERALAGFLSPDMRRKLCPPPQKHRFYWQLALMMLGLVLSIIAAARPQWGLRQETVMQRGRDLVIALDVSRSMLAQDVHPDRLQRSKADIQDLLRELRGDRAALIVFRAKALQLCPLTTDYAYLELALAEVSPESAPRGETDIGDAILKALDALESDAGAYQAIILISDGEDLAGKARAAAETARKMGVVIFTVGLGDPQGAKIPSSAGANEFMTYQGQEVVSKLQHDTLKTIAEITGGAYVPVGTANVKLDKLYRDHLSKLNSRDIEESIQRRYVERYQWFLLPALLAFLAAALLSPGRLGKNAKTRTKGMMNANGARVSTLLLVLAVGTGFLHAQNPQQTAAGIKGATRAGQLKAESLNPVNTNTATESTQALNTGTNAMAVTNGTIRIAGTNRNGGPGGTGRDGARHAQRLYAIGSYEEAARAYLAAMPGQTATLQNNCLYNAGNALYRAGQYQAAAEKYTELTTRQPEKPAAAFYNLGCAAFQMAEQAGAAGTNMPPGARPAMLERSGLAFQQALRCSADDEAARANLAVVTNLLPEAREQARIRALLEKYQGTPPPQLADALLENQRNIYADLLRALTNASPSRINQMEALSVLQRNNADVLIPLNIALSSALAQMAASSTSAAPQAAEVQQHIEAVRNTMRQATVSLRNIENEAYHPVIKAESGVYNLWKRLAQFPQLLREDIWRQTNAINLTTSVLTRAAQVELPAIRCQQNEARELTALFVERFSQAVPPGGMPPPGLTTSPFTGNLVTNQTAGGMATNAPEDEQTITEETRTNILALAQQATSLQGRALKYINSTNLAASLPVQRQAYDILKEIEKLLPKDKNKNQQQKQQQDEQQQKQDSQQQDQEQEQQQEQPQQEKQPENDQKPQDQQPQPESDSKPEQPQKDREMTPEQARALIEKVEQREKEHRDKKERDAYIPPSPVEKDW